MSGLSLHHPGEMESRDEMVWAGIIVVAGHLATRHRLGSTLATGSALSIKQPAAY